MNVHPSPSPPPPLPLPFPPPQDQVGKGSNIPVGTMVGVSITHPTDQGEVAMSQLMEMQEKLKIGSKELNRKLQNTDEQVRGWGMVM